MFYGPPLKKGQVRLNSKSYNMKSIIIFTFQSQVKKVTIQSRTPKEVDRLYTFRSQYGLIPPSF